MNSKVERFRTVRGTPLRLSLTPKAIREHFDLDARILALSDEQLAEVGLDALEDDRLYEAFHRTLADSIQNRHGFYPK